MLFVALTMVNLLIAVMNNAFETVNRVAALEVLHEKLQIVLAIEKVWLPMLVGRLGVDPHLLFPRWLHLLAPEVWLRAEAERAAKRTRSGDGSGMGGATPATTTAAR